MKRMKKFLICAICNLFAFGFLNATAQSGYYTVLKGDSLSGIAKGYDISLGSILKANPQIKDPDMIRVGQKVYIPNTDNVSSIEMELLELINRQRSSMNLMPLSRHDGLFSIAEAKSMDMYENAYFAHQSPTLGSPFSMIIDNGITFTAAGECIASGLTSAKECFDAWMNSEGNKNNILSGIYDKVGIGVTKADNGTLIFTALFIKSI